jgi:hypothetical protein
VKRVLYTEARFKGGQGDLALKLFPTKVSFPFASMVVT